MRSREREPFIFQTFEPRLLLTVGIYPSSDGHLEVHVEQLPPAADYQIYRGNAQGTWTPVADLGALDPYIGGDFVDTGVSIAGGSVYRYAAYDGNGNSLDTATLYTVSQIGAAVTDYTTAHLNWENNEPTLQFSLSRDATFLGNLGNASSYTDTGLELNTWYNYALNETTANQWSTIEVITAPPSPSGLVATAISGQEIDLHLSTSTSFQGPYNIYRSLTPDFAPDAAHFLAESGGQQFADTTVVSGTTYYYQITSFNPTVGLESPPADTSATTPVGAPVVTGQPIHAIAGSAYHGVVATFSQAGSGSGPAGHSAEINWGDGSPNGSTNGTSPDLAIIDNPDGTYSVIGTHTYAICSRTSATASVLVTYPFLGMQDSATLSVSIVEPPAAVSGLSATAGSSGSVDLNWSINGELTATAFRIDASTDGGTTFQPIGQVDAPDTTFDAMNLEGKTHYTFRVTPVNEAGDGVASAVLLTTGAVGKWYRVGFYDPAHPGAVTEPFLNAAGAPVRSTGSPSASLSLTPDAQAHDGWVFADSEADAVKTALYGSFGTDSVSGGGGPDYQFPSSGAFKFGNTQVLGANQLAVSFHNPASVNAASVDGYVPITIVDEDLGVNATTDQTLYSVPSANTSVGTFASSDPSGDGTHFAATVTWANATTSSATIIRISGGTYGVYVAGTAVTSAYTLSVTHIETNVTSYGITGGSSAMPSSPQIAPARAVSSPTNVWAEMNDAVAPSISFDGSTGIPNYDMNGQLPITETLHWTGETKGYYFVYYLNPATSKYELWQRELGGAKIAAQPTSLMSYLIHPTYVAPTSAHNGNNSPGNYFLIVHNLDGSTPTVSNGNVIKNGAASLHFSAPLLYFFGGRSDGDGIPGGPGRTPAPTTDTALGIAKFYDSTFGAQMTTYAWNEPYKWKNNGTLYKNLQLFPQHNFVLMGQSFGGGAAVDIADELQDAKSDSKNKRLTFPTVRLLQLYDPVATGPGAQGVAGGYYKGNAVSATNADDSAFTLTKDANGSVSEVTTAWEWYSSSSTENYYNGTFSTPTGALALAAAPPDTYIRQTDLGIAPGTYTDRVFAGMHGLTHVSSTVYSPAVFAMKMYITPYVSSADTYLSATINPWAF